MTLCTLCDIFSSDINYKIAHGGLVWALIPKKGAKKNGKIYARVPYRTLKGLKLKIDRTGVQVGVYLKI